MRIKLQLTYIVRVKVRDNLKYAISPSPAFAGAPSRSEPLQTPLCAVGTSLSTFSLAAMGASATTLLALCNLCEANLPPRSARYFHSLDFFIPKNLRSRGVRSEGERTRTIFIITSGKVEN